MNCVDEENGHEYEANFEGIGYLCNNIGLNKELLVFESKRHGRRTSVRKWKSLLLDTNDDELSVFG